MYSRKDSNFGWLIVAASFLSHFFQYGIVWTVGVFYVIFLEHIGGSSGAVALISSLNTAMFYSTGNVIDYSFIQNLNFYEDHKCCKRDILINFKILLCLLFLK